MSWKRIGQELPPRTRRIPDFLQAPVVALGTTSAYAENTAWRSLVPLVPGNYLRMRGEYSQSLTSCPIVPELPPRARRIRGAGAEGEVCLGTTSACAENTPAPAQSFAWPGNYLRVRGEYPGKILSRSATWELPPRARRIPLFGRENWRKMGTTSACAENTNRFRLQGYAFRNYLRVRGEYILSTIKSSSFEELPPRARRIRAECG